MNRIKFDFYLDVEGPLKDIQMLVRDIQETIHNKYEVFDPLVEPAEWRNLPDENGEGETDYMPYTLD